VPRDIPVGNGSLLVNFDLIYQLQDFYWPHVGQENHSPGHPFRFGLWADGQFRWIDHPGWERSLDYEADTLVTRVTLRHPDLALRLECADVVDFHENLYLRRLIVTDEAGRDREVRLLFAQDFHISGTEVADSVYYEPERRAVFHYKGKRWFMVNVAREESGAWALGVDQWAVGIKEWQGREGTWRDAEDGVLSGNAVAQGSVDSTVALHLRVPAGGRATGWHWIAVGEDFPEVTRINRIVRAKGPQTFLERTRHYWTLWLTKAKAEMAMLPPLVGGVYRRSLLILRSQIDNGGAIIAANDFDTTRFASDTYAYMWPRDGALVADALNEAGHSEVTRRFFTFCHQVITEEGYLLHKYTPDGSIASSWHGWYYEGKKQLPVQEDETALVLWALWRHFDRYREVEFIKPLYRGLVVRAANWMVDYRDMETRLPLPSWDLWEERRGVLAWTVGATWGGLMAGANFADAFGEGDLAAGYRRAADEIRAGADRHLWRDESRFVRMVHTRPDGSWGVDPVLDASIAGLWLFGMYPAGDPRVVRTMEAIRERLWVQTEIGGMARYEQDAYHRVTDDAAHVPGNPWFICTLWLAQWYAETARSTSELDRVTELLTWVCQHALPSGILAEQIHPYTGAALSVSPLTWSHAALVTTVHAYLRARGRVGG
jgi:GH15 family glucan-1,4-alpha-glucosidase